MTSRYEKHVYGESAPRSNKDWSKANPHDLKLTPIPEEKMCILCDTQKENIFGLTDVVMCIKCANEVSERTDYHYTAKRYFGGYVDPMFCARCGNDVVYGMKFNLHACKSCIEKAGRFQDRWTGKKIQRAGKARKVA